MESLLFERQFFKNLPDCLKTTDGPEFFTLFIVYTLPIFQIPIYQKRDLSVTVLIKEIAIKIHCKIRSATASSSFSLMLRQMFPLLHRNAS